MNFTEGYWLTLCTWDDGQHPVLDSRHLKLQPKLPAIVATQYGPSGCLVMFASKMPGGKQYLNKLLSEVATKEVENWTKTTEPNVR